MSKNIFLGLLCVVFTQSIIAQAGAKVYAGIHTATNGDENVTPDGSVHSGWEIGIDARLNNDRMYFLLGGKYGQTDLIATTTPAFFGGDNMKYIKGRVGLGFDLIKITSKFFITGKFLGSLKYINFYPRELLVQDGYTSINDGTAALVGGAGVRLGQLNVDIEYEHGLFNLYSKQKDSRMHYIALLFGINF